MLEIQRLALTSNLFIFHSERFNTRSQFFFFFFNRKECSTKSAGNKPPKFQVQSTITQPKIPWNFIILSLLFLFYNSFDNVLVVL